MKTRTIAPATRGASGTAKEPADPVAPPADADPAMAGPVAGTAPLPDLEQAAAIPSDGAPNTSALPETRAPQSNRARGSLSRKGATTKLGQIIALLAAPGGATLAELAAATGWQAHSIRGALAGSLRRKGLSIRSDKSDGVRRYAIGERA